MTHRFSPNPISTALVAVAALLPTFVASSAFAQEACGESTCDKGYHCEEMAAPCPLILCTDEADCEPCQPETVEVCSPDDCDSDSDCSDYMVCAAFDSLQCPEETPTCEPGDSDEACEAKWNAYNEQCETVELHQCAPKHNQPCMEASDCGDGFECIPYQCACAEAGGSDPESERLIAPEECVCPEQDQGYCSAIETACEGDTDCPEHWSCGENYNSICSQNAEGELDCEPADPPMVCTPPDPGGNQLIALAASSGQPPTASGLPGTATASGGESGTAVEELDTAPADLEEDEGPSAAPTDAEVMDLPNVEGNTEPDGDLEEAELDTADSNDAAKNTRANDDNDVVSGNDPEGTSSSSGCSVTPATSQSHDWSTLVAGLGLALSLFRRRSR